MFYIEFNGVTNRELGVAVTKRPSIPAPVQRGDYIEIAGRDGDLLVTDGTYKNIEIEVSMNFVRPPTQWNKTYRGVKTWLKGGGILKMSDDMEMFFKVKACGVSGIKRTAKVGGHVTAYFICDPYTYYGSGTLPTTIEQAKLNPYEEAHPIYKITGEGVCTLTVNDKSVTANVGQNLTIDTDLFLSYREDGTLQNTAITGDYADLFLPNGMNNIEISNGFDLIIIPNWRTL